jgi:hypothetical protein
MSKAEIPNVLVTAGEIIDTARQPGEDPAQLTVDGEDPGEIGHDEGVAEIRALFVLGAILEERKATVEDEGIIIIGQNDGFAYPGENLIIDTRRP